MRTDEMGGGHRARGRPAGRALPVALMAIGLAICCAPPALDIASRIWVQEQVSRVESAWSAEDDAGARAAWRQARAYNRVLAGGSARGVDVLPYSRQLAYGAWPFICYVRVPSVGIELPVYRGTGEQALANGAGHVEGTSLPVGGKGANCCISAHSGVAQAALFDDLRGVGEGDLVELRTLGRSLWYAVRSVEVVDPGDTSVLEAVGGEDLLTLVTCTSDPQPGLPRGGYGVNDRRLVVVGERCAAPAEEPARAPAAGARELAPLAAVLAIGASAAGTRALGGRPGKRRRALREEGDRP